MSDVKNTSEIDTDILTVNGVEYVRLDSISSNYLDQEERNIFKYRYFDINYVINKDNYKWNKIHRLLEEGNLFEDDYSVVIIENETHYFLIVSKELLYKFSLEDRISLGKENGCHPVWIGWGGNQIPIEKDGTTIDEYAKSYALSKGKASDRLRISSCCYFGKEEISKAKLLNRIVEVLKEYKHRWSIPSDFRGKGFTYKQ